MSTPPQSAATERTRPRMLAGLRTRTNLDRFCPRPQARKQERRHVLRVLEVADGQRMVAAQMLGLDRKTLYLKLARYAKTGPSQR